MGRLLTDRVVPAPIYGDKIDITMHLKAQLAKDDKCWIEEIDRFIQTEFSIYKKGVDVSGIGFIHRLDSFWQALKKKVRDESV